MNGAKLIRRFAVILATAVSLGCGDGAGLRDRRPQARTRTVSHTAAAAEAFARIAPPLGGLGSVNVDAGEVDLQGGVPVIASSRTAGSGGDLASRAALFLAGDDQAFVDEGPIEGSAEASIDDNLRFLPTTRPMQPDPQRPPLSTEANVDTNKPVHEWQRATDDWLGARPWLDDRGVSFQANWTLDYSKNFRGGVDTAGSAFRHLFNANVTLDTERLVGLKGGTFFLNFQNQSGDFGSDLTGDVQAYSNIDADGRTQISELWYGQSLIDGRLEVRVGKIDANSAFARVENGGEFIHSSMGVSPTIVGMPKYPDPSVGVDVFVRPTEEIYFGVGVYDGAGVEGVRTGERGPGTVFGEPSDLFVIAEGGVLWTLPGGRAGRAAFGVWHHTGRFEKFDGGTVGGATGPYVVVDQVLWRERGSDDEDAQGIGAFLQYGYADPDVSAFEHHVGGGLAWTGAVPGRDDDVLGLGASWVKFSDRGGAGFTEDGELAVELFYKMRLLKWLSVKPDLQYIQHPGGERGRDDAWVGTLRIVMDL
jgi:porin